MIDEFNKYILVRTPKTFKKNYKKLLEPYNLLRLLKNLTNTINEWYEDTIYTNSIKTYVDTISDMATKDDKVIGLVPKTKYFEYAAKKVNNVDMDLPEHDIIFGTSLNKQE